MPRVPQSATNMKLTECQKYRGDRNGDSDDGDDMIDWGR
jgi:hypothetical protein